MSGQSEQLHINHYSHNQKSTYLIILIGGNKEKCNKGFRMVFERLKVQASNMRWKYFNL